MLTVNAHTKSLVDCTRYIVSDPNRFDVDFVVEGMIEKNIVPVNYGRGLSTIQAAEAVVSILASWENDNWYSPVSIEVRKSQ